MGWEEAMKMPIEKANSAPAFAPLKATKPVIRPSAPSSAGVWAAALALAVGLGFAGFGPLGFLGKGDAAEAAPVKSGTCKR